MTEITFAIVGTAGRHEDAKKLSKKHFEAMYVVALGLLEQFAENNYPVTHLVSGGSAWADHVAVRLFLDKKAPNLRLYLPCEWEHGGFKSTGVPQNPADVLNVYHRKFKMVSNIHSLSDIQIAKNEGAELLPCRGGFYGRNAMVAKSDFLLAMTFGKEHIVKNGGTSDTVQRYLERVRKGEIYDKSFHYDLNKGEIFQGCAVAKETDDEIFLRKLKQGQITIPGAGNFSNIIAIHSYPP